MRSKAFRAVLRFAAGAVFLFSTVMVLKYHVEMRAGARQTEALVQSAVVQPSAQPDQTTVLLTFHKQQEPDRRLFSLMASMNVPILHLSRSEDNLEQIFLKVIAN